MRRMTQTIMASALLLGLIAVSSTAWAGDKVGVEFHGISLSSGDAGYTNLLGESESSRSGLTLMYAPEMIDGLRILAGMTNQEFSGQRFNRDLQADWSRMQVGAGADFGVDLLDDRIRPLARGTVGYVYQTLDYRADQQSYGDSSHGFAAFAGVGVEATALRSKAGGESFVDRLSIGMNLLVGYHWETRASFDEMTSESAPEEPTDEDPWARNTYDAGSIQATGVGMQFGLVLGYQF